MKNTMKKIAALLIAGVMMMSLLPLTVLADGEAPEAPVAEVVAPVVEVAAPIEEAPVAPAEEIAAPVEETPVIVETPVEDVIPAEVEVPEEVEEVETAEESETAEAEESEAIEEIETADVEVEEVEEEEELAAPAEDLVTVIFEADGCEVARAQIARGTCVNILPGAPEKESCSFIGWFYSVNGADVAFESWTVVSVDEFTVYAFYAEIPAEEEEFAAEEEIEELEEIEDEEIPLAAPVYVEEAEEVEEESGKVLTVGETPVRTDPDGLAPIDFSLEEGTAITVIAVEGDWIKVMLEDGSIGYIYKKNISEADLAAYTEKVKEEKAETAKTVTIFTSRRSIMTEGETVTLSSVLEGFEDCEQILYIWKVDKGNGFEEVDGANSDSYNFAASAESLSWGWHLTVLYC